MLGILFSAIFAFCTVFLLSYFVDL